MGFTSSDDANKATLMASTWCTFHALPKKLFTNVAGIGAMITKIAIDDPRRVTHSFKVGLALTLVSLFYYFQPLYESFGVSAMWAVMTVVVVFEFTVGATLGKGLNRAIATLLAGGLGVGTHHLASRCGKIGEPVLIGSFVFILATAATYMRFFPKIKARYDYGFLIFILTFSFVAISGYRGDEIIELAHKRLTTIAIGASVSLIINIFIFPVWAGEELHNSVALNMEKLGHFLEGFGDAFFKLPAEGEANAKSGSESLQSYRSVLNSKSAEDNLANFANWEPGHGQFRYNHPWNQYIKLGSLTRRCAYRIDALSAFFDPDIQVPLKFRGEIKDLCDKMSLQSSKALRKLGSSLRAMKHPSSSVNAHIVSSKAAAKSLNNLLKSSSIWQDSELLQVIPTATVASLLIDIVDCTEQIAVAFHDLAILANFRSNESNVYPEKSGSNIGHETVNRTSGIDCPQTEISVAELTL